MKLRRKHISIVCTLIVLATNYSIGQNQNVFPTTGNVGIGTGTSNATLFPLHIKANSNEGFLLNLETNGSFAGFFLKTPSANKKLGLHFLSDAFQTNSVRFARYNAVTGDTWGNGWEANPIVLDLDAPDNSLVLSESGSLGIGTAAPASKLHIAVQDQSNAVNLINTISTKANWPGFRIDNYDGNGYGGYPVVELSNIRGAAGSPSTLASGSIIGLFGFNTYSGNNVWGQSSQIYSKAEGDHSPTNGTPGRLVFSTTPLNNTVPQVRMVINSNGWLGLGTDNPLDKFQMGDRFTLTDGGWKGMLCNMRWNTSLQTMVRIFDGPLSAMYYTDKGNTAFLNGPINTAGSTANDAKYTMIMYTSGQVGVGTSYDVTGFSDQSTKLFVEGGMKARKVKVDQANWADYVFHSSYKLRSLNEVENYIKQNNHLPEVPSEAEVKEKGIDVGEMNKVLLQKVEELTLYIIEQNKRIEDQQKELKI